jgi:hypothetical protein
MNNSDFNTFSEAWADAHEVMAAGKVLSERAMESIFHDLEDYPLNVVVASINIHRKSAKFAPTVFDIVEIIGDRTGAKHIGAEEAWSIALESFDEYSTVVWTQPISEARGVAYGLFMDGDKVAARMAFKDAYTRIIKTAAEPSWTVTEGFDLARRADAVQQAVLLKRLPHGSDARYRLEAPTTTTQALIERSIKISGKITELPANNENLKRRWSELSGALHAGQLRMAEKQAQRVIDAENKRFEFERMKQDMLDVVDAKLNGAKH